MTSAECPYPFARPSALLPPEELAGLRARSVVPVTLPSGDSASLVTRYEDVRGLLTDTRLSRNLNREGAARISKHNSMFQDPKMDPDPPEHTRMRRLITKAFTATRVRRMEPFIQRVVDELLDEMQRKGNHADLNEAFSFPLPIRVICHLLGVPTADVADFRRWTAAFLSVNQFPREQIKSSMQEMSAYIAALIERKRAEPQNDLISALIRVHDTEDGKLDAYEMQWWCRLLLLVGYETTATQLSGGVAMLLSHPDQLALLRADFSLLPGAIEELLRWKLVGSSVSMLRYATADIPLGDTVIPAGTSVIPGVDSANQDPEVFYRPEEFDITRKDNNHLTFSLGPHYCIGANLARLELELATGSLLRRFPDLELAVKAEELRRQPGALLEGFTELPVHW